MVEVKDRQHVTLASTSNLIIFKAQSDVAMNNDEWPGLSSFVESHLVLKPLATLLNELGVGASKLRANWFYLTAGDPFEVEFKSEPLLASQAIQLSHSGIRSLRSGGWEIDTIDGPLKIEFERLESHFGSFSIKRTLKVVLPDPQQVSSAVLASLIFSVIPTYGENITVAEGKAENSLFVCYLNRTMPDEFGQIMDTAVTDLKMSANFSELERQRVWRNRQLCLKAAGYDPGLIDGINGPKTEAAFKEFAKDIPSASWKNENIIRLLIMQAASLRGSKDSVITLNMKI
ncbi:peptidoglycan-binding domain-containing protein [Roseovarius aestuarii]|uniref:Peptidoglycan binding domain protein n=1 Tax=Roseovarius aestuarii TaxID=475083 RepID=A0A1X7BMY2_9RHOB|nr:peptidoglycan-binding domain-containing protein [Roseovarius aestuarii]SMC10973.1 hypothetical protein ROA7745_00782 [Roseovarius aestuarii]